MKITLKETLKKVGDFLVKQLRNELDKDNANASGELNQSIQAHIRETNANKLEVDIQSLPYLKYIDEGRKPGIFPPVNKLEKWINDKGIKPNEKRTVKETAWAMAMGINKKGIPSNPKYPGAKGIVQKVKDDNMITIKNMVGKGFKQEIKLMINKEFIDFIKK